jgi:sec-independent protein translocase protein TatB
VFNLQGSEIIFILLLALVFLGPEKLPDAIRRFTRTYGELRKMGSGFQSELRSVLDEPMREARETAGLLRDAADPDKIAEAGSSPPLTADAPSTAEPPADDDPGPDGPATDDDVQPADDEPAEPVDEGPAEPVDDEAHEPEGSADTADAADAGWSGPEGGPGAEVPAADTAGSPEEPAPATDDAAGRHRAAHT